ncbi:MAG: hypothetical protein GWN02_35685 [Gemmatimonadetes bacterium]|nr:hypothetical protein [Gemmatimonadota bacterium]
MEGQREWSPAGGKGRDDARAALARLHTDVAWLAAHWEQLGLDECLDHLAGARRRLSAAGAALLRDHFFEVLAGGSAEPGDLERVLDLMYRIPGGRPYA